MSKRAPHLIEDGHGRPRLLDLYCGAWMQTKAEIAEAIPPAYTELVGQALLEHLRVTA